MGKQSWPSMVIAVVFLALVGYMFKLAVGSQDFSEIWAAVGPLVGVVTGAIPAYFFANKAKQESERAAALANEALEQAERLISTIPS